MAEGIIRVGLIGAGRNVRNRHIPGFQKVAGCEIVAVANRSIESGQRVAEQFNIPRVYASWQELLEDDSINAVCIGTWPYMHRTLTLAALEKGKHVLTEARMASTAQEARERHRTGHHGPLRNRRALYGVDGSRAPQFPDRAGGVLAVIGRDSGGPLFGRASRTGLGDVKSTPQGLPT